MTNHDWIDYSILVNDVVKVEVKISKKKCVNNKMTGSWLRQVPSGPFLPSLISASLLFAAYSIFNHGKSFQEVGKYFFCLFLKISTSTMAITSLPLQRTEHVRAWCWSTTGCRARHQGTWQGGHHYDDDHHRPQGAGQGGQEGDGELSPRAWQAHQDRAEEETVAWL